MGTTSTPVVTSLTSTSSPRSSTKRSPPSTSSTSVPSSPSSPPPKLTTSVPVPSTVPSSLNTTVTKQRNQFLLQKTTNTETFYYILYLCEIIISLPLYKKIL